MYAYYELIANTSSSYERVYVQFYVKSDVRKMKQAYSEKLAKEVKDALEDPLKRAMTLSEEKGSSSWFTALPIEEYGFSLRRGAFLDTIALRYNWTLSHNAFPPVVHVVSTFQLNMPYLVRREGSPHKAQ